MIVVLGYRNRGLRANAVNRYRVRAGLRSVSPTAATSTVVFSGGPVDGEVAEADLMESYARDRCSYTGSVLVERQSRSTWDNVRCVIPMLEDADRICLVSNSLHAEKARAYLWRQRPDLAVRLARGADYRFGEVPLLKVVGAVRGLRTLRRRRTRRVID